MWKTRDLKNITIAILVGCNILFLFFSLWITKQFVDMDIHVLQWLKLAASLPQLIIPFFIFRKRFFQNLFLFSTSAMYYPVSNGIGNYATTNWFASSANPLLAGNMVTIVLLVVTLPPLLYFLRRLCKNPGMIQSFIWRYIWILPLVFLFLIILNGTYLTVVFPRGINFFAIRGILYAALLLICYLLDAALRQATENIVLRENVRFSENQLALQREQYEKVLENEKAVKTMHHDIRHHFTVIGQLAEDGENGKIIEYSEDIVKTLRQEIEVRYCENRLVNVICAKHLELAKKEGITVDAQLDIPEDTGNVPAMDLCIIMGNILENAYEACRRMENDATHGKFIRLRSQYRPDNGTLAFVVENSFDGVCNVANGVYMSRKESEGGQLREGVGLSSIQAVCKKHGGFAEFTVKDKSFRVSAIVKTVEWG